MGTRQSHRVKYSRSAEQARIAVQRERVVRKAARSVAPIIGRGGFRPSPAEVVA